VSATTGPSAAARRAGIKSLDAADPDHRHSDDPDDAVQGVEHAGLGRDGEILFVILALAPRHSHWGG